MAKRNSGGPSSRRGSSRSSSTGRSFDKNSSRKSERNERDSISKKRSSPGARRKDEKDSSDRAFSSSNRNKFSKKPSSRKSSFQDGESSSFPKKRSSRRENSNLNSSSDRRRSGARGDKPFNKFDQGKESFRPKKRFSDESSGNSRKSSPKSFKKVEKRDENRSSGREERSFFDNKRRSKPSYRAQDARKKAPTESEAPAQTDKMRLNRFIANGGVCSRREADELIAMGLISVNGKAVTEMGYKVNPGDEVRYEGKVLRAEKPVYILLNKPKGYLTTTEDPQERNTVMHLIGTAVKERVYPVGRLDRNTTGLLLLTNDGDLADKLMHPSYNVKKIYKVELDRPLTKADFQKLQEGIRLDEGVAHVDDLAIISDDGKTVGVELHIGWNRVVRRIFEALNYEVLKLDRSVYAGLDKKDLGRGHWRFLTKEELIHLKHFK